MITSSVDVITSSGDHVAGSVLMTSLPATSDPARIVFGSPVGTRFISHKVFLKSFCRSQLPHKSVNLSSTITNIKLAGTRC